MTYDGYGHAYLTSYGWTGSGTGLRKGAIDKPLAIPQKKNLSGLGKDRDEGFPFWDHLFTAASKAITIKVSGDDEDIDGTQVSEPIPVARTTTGIISNRRPIVGTPASASGSATDADPSTSGHLSLVATAKREAAKRGLYARFFRGPVLGPSNDDPPLSHPVSTSASKHIEDDPIMEEARRSKKRKSKDGMETKEERRERKRLKKDRKAARAAKKTKMDGKKNHIERKHYDKETRSEDDKTILHPDRRPRKSVTALSSEKDDQEPAECKRKDIGGKTGADHLVDPIDALGTQFIKRKKRQKDIQP